jgi:hypothetical protein
MIIAVRLGTPDKALVTPQVTYQARTGTGQDVIRSMTHDHGIQTESHGQIGYPDKALVTSTCSYQT